MIHVGFISSNLFAKFVGTAMLSMFENHDTPPRLPSITVHILHDSTFSIENRDKFTYLADKYEQRVEFYNIEEKFADKIAEILQIFPEVYKPRFSTIVTYSLFFPFILSTDIEKAILLDGDLIVNLDIKELWQYELGDKVLGVVSEKEMGSRSENKALCIDGHVKVEDYFNSGMLLMNLNLLRKEEDTLANAIKFMFKNPSDLWWLVEQDTWNYAFSARTLKLPLKFNLMIYLRRKDETDIDRKIYHYATPGCRNFLNQKDCAYRLYMKYFMKTPWFDEDAMGKLYEGFLGVRNDLLTLTAKLSAIVSGKTRAFFVEPSRIEAMKKFFFIRDDEKIIPAENEDSINKLIDAMKASQDKFVFFIMTPRFLNKDFPFDLLTKEGFAVDKDFVRGWVFLTDAYGNPFNSYPLIRAM